jgi:hypothetical protein
MIPQNSPLQKPLCRGKIDASKCREPVKYPSFSGTEKRSIGWESAQEKMREVPRGAAPLNPIQFEQ